MTKREQIYRGRLRSAILLEKIDEGDISIFCPKAASRRLYEHFVEKGFQTSPPTPAIFGAYPDDELIVRMTLDQANAEVSEFVASLPFEMLE